MISMPNEEWTEWVQGTPNSHMQALFKDKKTGISVKIKNNKHHFYDKIILKITEFNDTHPPVIILMDSNNWTSIGCHFHILPQSHWKIHITQLQKVCVRPILIAASNSNCLMQLKTSNIPFKICIIIQYKIQIPFFLFTSKNVNMITDVSFRACELKQEEKSWAEVTALAAKRKRWWTFSWDLCYTEE